MTMPSWLIILGTIVMGVVTVYFWRTVRSPATTAQAISATFMFIGFPLLGFTNTQWLGGLAVLTCFAAWFCSVWLAERTLSRYKREHPLNR